MQFSLRELRARQGWTQREAAKRVGVSTTAYNAWEKSLSNVRIKYLVKIADTFGVPMTDIKVE